MSSIEGYFEGLADVKAPVWQMTLMHLPYCSATNTLAEAQVTSFGTTTSSCQAIPTPAGAVSVNVEKGFCARFWYSSNCKTGSYQSFCDKAVCAAAYPPNARWPQLFSGFDVVPA